MKTNKKTKLILIIIPIIALVALMSFVLANTVNNPTSKTSVTRDRTSVILKQQDDPKIVDIYLGMADDSSVTSFQVGLNVEVAYNYDASFEWADNLNDGTEEFKDYTINEGKDSENNRDLERINIYYVGTKELNELTVDKNVDNIKIGTITLDYEKDIDGNPVSEAGSTLLIQPVGKDGSEESDGEVFTKTLSVSHEVTPVVVRQDDILRADIPGTEEPGTDPSDPGTGGDNTTNPGSGGSGSDSETETPPGGSGTTTPGTGNQGQTENDGQSENGSDGGDNGQSIGDRFINAFKTGGNHSYFGIICLVVVLVIIAGIIMFVKIRNKKDKH